MGAPVETNPDRNGAVAEVFDEPALWRAEIISRFRLRGAERCAAASPSPGFPRLLNSMVGAIGEPPPGTWLDVGGGLGGVASWIGRTLGRTVVSLDPSVRSLQASCQLFHEVPVVAATGQHLPVRSGSVPVVLLCGVVSLLDDLEPLIAEAGRVLRDDGSVIVTDLWSATASSVESPPNVFWSLERFLQVAGTQGLHQRHVAVTDTSTGWWSESAAQVADEIRRRYADREGFDAWRRDTEHLETVVAEGAVLAAGAVLSRDAPAVRTAVRPSIEHGRQRADRHR